MSKSLSALKFFEKSKALCARAEFTCQIESTLSARLRSIGGWRFGREEKSGSEDLIRRVAKKALFPTLFGLLTMKTLASSYKQVVGKAYAGCGTPG